ncbi:MAG: response regulator [Pseudomonadota bacterium]
MDDEEKFATMLAKRLELRGCTCMVCYDGTSAIDRISQHNTTFTLILLDLQLPDLYGTQVLARIKSINPAIPVLILTGHGTEKDHRECMNLGAHKFIHKPLDINTLLTLLNQIKGTP